MDTIQCPRCYEKIDITKIDVGESATCNGCFILWRLLEDDLPVVLNLEAIMDIKAFLGDGNKSLTPAATRIVFDKIANVMEDGLKQDGIHRDEDFMDQYAGHLIDVIPGATLLKFETGPSEIVIPFHLLLTKHQP